MSNAVGSAILSAGSTGDYSVWVRRISYHEARFTVHLQPNCQQILEVYLTRSAVEFDRCLVVTSGARCPPEPKPTPGRVVFTTCALAA